MNIPRLRFPKFDENWEKKKLEDVGKIRMCKRIFNHQTSVSGDIPFFKIGTFGKKPDSFIPNELYHEFKHKYSYPKVGDILISASGTLGRTVVFDGSPSYFQDSNIVWIDNKENLITNEFLYYIYKIVRYESEGGTIQRLYNSIIYNTKFWKPSLPEQQKIADFLTSVDKRIELLEKKKTLLETYKKGVMKKIFNQEIRFKDDNGSDFPDWEEKRLGSVCKIQGGYAFKSISFEEVGIPIIRISNISNDNDQLNLKNLVYYDEIPNEESYIINKGDLLIAMSGATTGKTSISDYNGKCYLNQRVGLFKIKSEKLNYSFLVQYVFSSMFRSQLLSYLVAGAQPNISSKDIESVTIPLPSFQEQIKISELLNSIVVRVELLDTQIDKAKTWKKGLLQKMFV